MGALSPLSEPQAPVLGSTYPRLSTPPLITGEAGPCGCGCALTPATSYGFDVDDFARDVLKMPLDPWQRWLIIHAGELLPDGRPRFRTVLCLVARQQGKTHLTRVLTLYWLFIEKVPLILSTSTTLATAKASWKAVIDIAKGNRWLKGELGKDAVRATIGEEALTTLDGSRYQIAASNRRAGRGLTVHRLILDELREHKNREAWDAAVFAMNAVPDAQVFAITNQGDDQSVVLDSLRDRALAFIDRGEGNYRVGLFEWSAPVGMDPADLDALALANPDLGRRTDPEILVGEARAAKAAGGEDLTSFKTEILCQRVQVLNPAIEPDRWMTSATSTPLNLAEYRESLALCVDLALDGSHASLVGAALIKGKVHVEVIEQWSGYGCTKALRADLPGIVAQIRPRALGWFPNGPAASVAAELVDRGGPDWPPRRVTVEELKGDTAAVCMGLAEQVTAGEIVHPGDPMLDQHVGAAEKLPRGDAWVFTRRGASAIDGAYALAGAVHLARTLPPPPPKLIVLSV